ncbi:hypothetical protein [Xanthobacter aminoxidans]|uniref:hypothetical protein n=1 Tax=Xanthobacter aminoxidans TaxID=186280 RepID=UPI002022F49A|nr:hypothetical protein [Xanthobacter aminoxidans]MCL8385277.1 hypothetical protein [Xanthobacter aminoxidans]
MTYPAQDKPLSIRIFWQTARTDGEKQTVANVLLPGLKILGDDVAISHADYEPCDVAVIIFSPRKNDAPTTGAARYVRNLHGPNLLILETPLFRQCPLWRSRLGFDHVHRGGRFGPASCPPDRFETLGLSVAPWRTDGEALVVAGQVADDYSLDGIDIDEWAVHVVRHLKSAGYANVVFRPHPLGDPGAVNSMQAVCGVEISSESLDVDLQRAGHWISYSSGSAIDAVLAGVPSLTLSRFNFAWEVSRHSIRHVNHPIFPDRMEWLSRLAYAQWSDDEIRLGLAWRNLRPFVI